MALEATAELPVWGAPAGPRANAADAMAIELTIAKEKSVDDFMMDFLEDWKLLTSAALAAPSTSTKAHTLLAILKASTVG
jgi:hypothetical protein